MAADSPPAAPLPSPHPSERFRDKVRIPFRKHGALRFLTPHDLLPPYPPRRCIRLRPLLRHPPRREAGPDAPGTDRPPLPFLEMDRWLPPAGTARPEEVLTLLGLQDLPDAGYVLERTRLELCDEVAAPT